MDDRRKRRNTSASGGRRIRDLLEKARRVSKAWRLVEVYEQLGDLAEREADPFKFNDEDDEEYDEDDEEEKPDFTQAREYFRQSVKIRKRLSS